MLAFIVIIILSTIKENHKIRGYFIRPPARIGSAGALLSAIKKLLIPPVQKLGAKKGEFFALLAFGPFEVSRGVQILKDRTVLGPTNAR
jgi:hypothetical protein